ncbi:glycerophosphodiester phosphodiesterase family protein [Tropicibacter sp. Alg240-R139]|uniref:glycerophosphodiester phosphodiesterase family protein n=1 Tax=Tropicibacter sp. Alg240-R139 TaxID=2305991 RepID=UPI0013E00BD0|nr:glycerophosphodiester phosphodiesterase family protein [Tropicibacter sp. Alg240-R139]
MTEFPQLAAFQRGHGVIRLVGHRGARGVMPENTMQGFEFTLACGVKLLEFDVAITRDGVPVITHNHHLTRSVARDGSGNWIEGDEPKLSSLTWKDLAAYDVGGLDGQSAYGQRFPDQAYLNGARIPRLSDLCALINRPGHGDIHLMLEIKSDPDRLKNTQARAEIVAAIVDEVRTAGLTKRTLMHSFDWDLLQECAAQAPEMPTSFLTQLPENDADVGEDEATQAGPVITRDSYHTLPDLVSQAGGRLWCPYFLDVTADTVMRAQDLGLIVAVWTVNEANDIDRMIDLGVDAIVTDYPGRVQRKLLDRGLDWLPRACC